jgi:dTDP-4-dehydrorhamnose reductase
LGSIRSDNIKIFFSPHNAENLVLCNDITNFNDLSDIFDKVQPNVVINCISLDKALLTKSSPLLMIPIYALLPHQLEKLCSGIDARLIHISTDGVFSGSRGNYVEDDACDAQDSYGITKYIGEVHEPHTITIRTSIIGHELKSKNGLVEWFLSQKAQVQCFDRVIFSGFPTVVLAQIIRDFVIPNFDLNGVYHIASSPISKRQLLLLIAEVYGKKIKFITNNKVKIDRSLNGERFRIATGYIPPDWQSLVKSMHSNR